MHLILRTKNLPWKIIATKSFPIHYGKKQSKLCKDSRLAWLLESIMEGLYGKVDEAEEILTWDVT